MRRSVLRVAAVAAVALLAAACGASSGSSTPAKSASSAAARTQSTSSAPGLVRSTVVASTGLGRRDIGVLLRYRDGDVLFHCGAAVVASRSGDVIATAAHCVSTPGTTYAFAPGYTPAGAPLGLWPVVSVHTGTAWQRRTDPRDDIAFLAVRPRVQDGREVTLQQVTGALRLGVTSPAPTTSTTVRLVGYPSDRYGGHLTCTAALRLTDSYPTATCPYFTGGTSGSPFVGPGDRLVGVVGGLQSGGCTPDVSYSSPFTSALRSLLEAADTAATAGAGGASSPLPRSLPPSPCP